MVIPDDVFIKISLPERDPIVLTDKVYLFGGHCFESPDQAT
jgi:hypothetical protein